MNISDVMDDLGTALGTIDGLRVFPWWVRTINPPAAVVGFPEKLTYDATQRRGGDRLALHIIVAVGQVDSRTARDALTAYTDGSGARSVKTVIEAHAPTAYDSVRVTEVDFGTVTIASVEYLSATFTVDLIGRGA